jgi:hypothetical protein
MVKPLLSPSRRWILFLSLSPVLGALFYWSAPSSLRHYFYVHLEPAPLGKRPPLRELGMASAATCGKCHTAIFSEWRESLHGQAMVDRFFVTEWADQANLFVCRRCHAPLLVQQPTLVSGFRSLHPPLPEERPNGDFQPALVDEGVTCLVCHQDGTSLMGPLQIDGQQLPHETRIDPQFGANGLCQRCHDVSTFPGSRLLRPALATFVEHEEYRARGGTQRCVDCHFPAVERPLVDGGPVRRGRSHRLRGARDADFVRSFLEVATPTCEIQSGQLHCRVALVNHAGHRMPTGEPGRELVVALRPASDAAADERHILRRFDRIDLIERPGEDSTLAVAERRPFDLRTTAGSAQLAIDFCFFEQADPLLRQTNTDYRSLCRNIARWNIEADGKISAR